MNSWKTTVSTTITIGAIQSSGTPSGAQFGRHARRDVEEARLR